MMYVKIYNETMKPLGFLELGAELVQSDATMYVKVYNEALTHCEGVVALSDNISETDAAKHIKVYDENKHLAGGGVVGDILPATPVDPTLVDLGLPSGTKWRSMNLGASAPEEAGLYFQWGDTQGYSPEQIGLDDGKKPFDIDKWSDYKFLDSFDTQTMTATFTKYNSTDGKTTLDADDDAAVTALATPWVMPTKAQLEELINEDYTTMEWTTENGVNGYRITSKSNGNSIFLPAAGSASDGSVRNVGSGGYYRSASLVAEDMNYAFYLSFNSVGIDVDSYYRCSGYSVRPVQNASV